MTEKQKLINEITRELPALDTGYLRLLTDFAEILQREVDVTADGHGPFTEEFARHFAGVLLVHHALSEEPFTKDKFEHAMVRVLNESDLDAHLSPRGNPGHDLTVGAEKWSLKTQADQALKLDALHISKFMEMGKGEWTNETSLTGLRQRMFDHVANYDRIFSLRHKIVGENRYYELVEIPKALLLEAENGELEMKMDSKQNPKPGYCRVYDRDRSQKFQLYFDGGTERKLQIKHLKKALCHVRASWTFKKD
ncbi:hypothetical protein QVZ43_10880 [Marinobacter sp. chi1]|uniref:Restriction endonuclease n=1 Tax=Marinobacter suaedae TaxID=3057675 RepID=A0ABT8W1V8_9GAMM|nr:hypothetical protein [Marinobacter sp. chi1]MDO3722227.1 hypothetical protein [Marinobacter sp. chi1]